MKKNLTKKFILIFSFIFIILNINTVLAITIPDTTPPVITLKGSTLIELTLNDTYIDQGATATDDIDKDITTNIIKAGDRVDISKTGTYTITYNVSDSSGNPAIEVTRVVTVVAPKITIHLDIETKTETLYNKDIEVTACDSDNDPTTPITLSAYCAILQSNLTNNWSWSGSDAFLNSIGTYVNNDNSNGVYWGWFGNLSLGQTALNKDILNSGDQILLTYNTNPLKITTSSSTPTVGDATTFTVTEFGYDSSWNPTWSPATDGTILIGTNSFPLDNNGTYIYTPIDTNPIIIIGKKDGYIDTSSLTVSPVAPKITIHLDIETKTETLYNKDIEVTACDSDNDPTTPITLSAYCAILQSNLTNNWSWSGSDAFLNSIGTYVNNDNSNGVYWGWFGNLSLGQTALNKDILNSGDQILLTYNTNPLKITTSSSTPTVGDATTFTVTEFGYDSSWNPTWSPATDGTILIGTNSFPLDNNGTYIYTPIDTNPIIIIGKKDGYIDTSSLTVSPVAPLSDGGGSSGGNGGNSSGTSTKIFSIQKAIDFLSANENIDGSFSNDMYTDWVAIAVAKTGDQGTSIRTKIYNYLINKDFSSTILTDYERRAMSLMSLNINPYFGTNINYIKKITDSFDGQQIGDSSLYNDDIFALIVLGNAGYSSNNNIIIKIINFILSKQKDNGSWESVDITAAAIQALNKFNNINSVQESINKGLDYLSSIQDTDGGYNNSFSTSWVIQAFSVNNLYQTQLDKALIYLTNKQQDDGGVDNLSNPNDSRIWATAYSIPAELSLSWTKILNNFSKPIPPVVVIYSSGGGGIYFSSQEDIIEQKKGIKEPLKKIEKDIIPIIKDKILKTKSVFKKIKIQTKNSKIILKDNKLVNIKKKIDINNNQLLAVAGKASINNPISGSRIILFILSILMIILWGRVIRL